MAEDYVLQTKITADSTEFQNAIKGVSDSLNGIKKSLTKATDNIKKGTANWGLDLDKFYDKGSGIFKSFGVDIDKFASHFGVSGKLVAAITVATVALTKFGQSMNGARAELAKGTGAIGEDLIKLQDTFHKAMIEGIGRDAKEVGGMMADLNTRFGATGEELVAMTDEFDKFAEVMGVDARQAINTTADIMAKWGLETEKLSPLLDQLTTASQMSGATIDELTNGLKQGQAVFSQFGMSATDSIAMLSSFAKNGLETTTAINSMRFALNTFSKAGIDAKKGLEETTEAIKTASSETEALSIASSVFGAKNGAEMVKVLKSGALSADDFKTALMNAGGALEATDKASRTTVDAFADLKATLAGTFAGFGEGFDNLFRDLIDSIQEVVKFIAPVIEPIGNIFRDVFSAIGQMLKILVDNFIEFQKRYNTVFSAVTSVIQTVYETIHKVLSNIVEVFGTAFSFIFAILDGKWGLAWEYAKKQVLLFSKNISDILSGIVDLFAKMINGVIEKLNSAIDLYHKLPKSVQIFDIQNIDKISESIDLASKWNITGKLAETQQKIDELTGKASEKIIGDLGKVKEVSTDVSDTMKSEAMEVSQISIDWSDKLLQQEIAVLEKEREDAVNRAKLEEQTEREIFDIKKSYADKIYALQVKQIEAQRDAEIKKVKASKESLESQKDLIAKINKYYDTQKSLIKDSTSFIEKSDKAIKKSSNSWDSWIKSFEDKANDWTTMTVDMANIGTQAMGDMFTQIGEGLVNGGNGYEDFASIAVEALAEVLKGLAAQLSALAAVNAATYNYGKAAAAAAGAAAALVAAGALKAVASNLKSTSTAAKEATNSIDDFIKRLQNIKETRFTQIGTFSQGVLEYSAEITNAIKNMDEAYAKYEETRKAYGKKYDYYYTQGHGSPKYDWVYEEREAMEKAQKNYSAWVNKVSEANTGLSNSLTELVQNSKDTVDENSAITSSYRELYNSINKVSELQKQLSASDNAEYAMIKSGFAVGDITKTIRFQYEKYNSYLKTLKNNIKAQVQEMENSVYESMLSVGKDIGETFISSIVDGATKTDFMSSIRDYIKKQMIQLAILTDDFSDRISNIGVKLLSAMTTGNSAAKTSSLKLIATELESLYTEMTEKANDVENILTSVFGKVKETSDELSQNATTIGDTLMQNILNGAKKSDFLSSMKSYIKESVLKVAIYSSSLTDKITSIGEKLSQAVLSGSKSQIKSLKTQLSSLYKTTVTQVKGVLSIIDEVFPENIIEESLTSFEEAMKSFNDSVKDIGGDIASNLIDGITNGLSQSDFLSNMKDWLRKMLVQTVVYTETMKAEIEEIGKRISEGITTGFTDTSLHEIRRDLSYIFESASSKMSNIDSILNSVFDGYASGTESATRGLHIVGEAGPELVRFRGGERVYNNRDTMGIISGNKTNNFNVTFNNMRDTSAFAMMNQLKQYNRELAVNGVI